MHELSVGFFADWSAVGGGWFATRPTDTSGSARRTPIVPPFAVTIWQRLEDGSEVAGLPDGCADVVPELDAAVALLTDAYRPVDFDALDVTPGWRNDASRLEFLDVVDRAERKLHGRLRGGWVVEVRRSPGVTEIRLMGAYGGDWPLWTNEGLSAAEDWPMLSEALADRLRAWAADAARDPGPGPEVTDDLLRDLRAELGALFSVVANV